MNNLQKGLILALVQMLLVLLVSAKLMIDRSRYPDVWVETAPYDPDLPLRGRYVRMLAVVEPSGSFPDEDFYYEPARLEVKDDILVAEAGDNGRVFVTNQQCGEERCVVLAEPLAFFIPEGVDDPSIREEGEQLWVRVSVPPHGAPRPIELGVKKSGKLVPLEF